MIEPAQNRSLAALKPIFKRGLEAFLKAAKAKGFDVLVYETGRTLERQLWLYGQGRTAAQCKAEGVPAAAKYARGGMRVTFTVDSLHRYDCAVDLVPLHKGAADWAGYAALYKAVPPAKFGLELLSWEKPHLQLKGGQARARALGFTARV